MEAGLGHVSDEVNIIEGRLSKRILNEGSGRSTPPLHAQCLVHYSGKIKSTGEIFMDTRVEGIPARITAGRDSVLQGAGLNLGCGTMRIGESAAFDVHPELGYGSKGNFSFPSIPPNAWLEYKVEMINFEPVEEGKASRDMLFEERLEAAERRRKEGNELFQQKLTADALGKYSMALSYMDQDFMFQLQGAHEENANAVRLPTLLNISACQLQLGDYDGAIQSCSQVLAVSRDNGKALFRRGKAHRLAGRTDSAARDLKAARVLMPKDSAVRDEIQILRSTAAEDRKAADAMFKGVLGAQANTPAGATGAWWQRLCAWLHGLGRRLIGRLASWSSRPSSESQSKLAMEE